MPCSLYENSPITVRVLMLGGSLLWSFDNGPDAGVIKPLETSALRVREGHLTKKDGVHSHYA